MPRGSKDRLTSVAVKAATFQGSPFKKFDGGGGLRHNHEARRLVAFSLD